MTDIIKETFPGMPDDEQLEVDMQLRELIAHAILKYGNIRALTLLQVAYPFAVKAIRQQIATQQRRNNLRIIKSDTVYQSRSATCK